MKERKLFFRGVHFFTKIWIELGIIYFIQFFLGWFQIYDFFQDLTHPEDAQLLPCLLAQFWWATKPNARQFGLSKKNFFLYYGLKSKLCWESAIKIFDVAGTPILFPSNTYTYFFFTWQKDIKLAAKYSFPQNRDDSSVVRWGWRHLL